VIIPDMAEERQRRVAADLLLVSARSRRTR
jgi:hypothetical protein